MVRSPTHSEVTRFISSLLPPKANDVSLLYHLPQIGSYSFETAIVEQVVLSVTPSPNVYEAISDQDDSTPTASSENRQPSEEARPPFTICFLHQPFTLDRRRVRQDVLVLASHTSFDENLTVGWNPRLAERLGLNLVDCLCIQGYKGDDQRKVGLVGRVSMILGPLLRGIEEEFGAIEHAQEGLSEEIHVVAIMNAFQAGEVDRVLDMAQEHKWVSPVGQPGRNVLYLTGQPRESGLSAAMEQGMTVVCVGHRVAEQWGISYMATCLRSAFPGILVKEVYEDSDGNGVPSETE